MITLGASQTCHQHMVNEASASRPVWPERRVVGQFSRSDKTTTPKPMSQVTAPWVTTPLPDMRTTGQLCVLLSIFIRNEPNEQPSFAAASCLRPTAGDRRLSDKRLRRVARGRSHSNASLMVAAAIHLKVIQERLRHSAFQLTEDTYSHLLRGGSGRRCRTCQEAV